MLWHESHTITFVCRSMFACRVLQVLPVSSARRLHAAFMRMAFGHLQL